MTDAVARAYKQELPSGGFTWQVFDAASHAQLMGVTLARWALLKFGSAPRRKTVGARTATTRPVKGHDEIDAMSMAF